jgi:hypothetical protein
MTYLMILEKLPILTNLKTFYYLGMEMNANVMHVKKIKKKTGNLFFTKKGGILSPSTCG